MPLLIGVYTCACFSTPASRARFSRRWSTSRRNTRKSCRSTFPARCAAPSEPSFNAYNIRAPVSWPSATEKTLFDAVFAPLTLVVTVRACQSPDRSPPFLRARLCLCLCLCLSQPVYVFIIAARVRLDMKVRTKPPSTTPCTTYCPARLAMSYTVSSPLHHPSWLLPASCPR